VDVVHNDSTSGTTRQRAEERASELSALHRSSDEPAIPALYGPPLYR
jgi:hypothetical protein